MVKQRKVTHFGYDALAESYDYVHGQNKHQEQFLSLIWLNNRLKNGSKVLDIGSGTGREAKYLSKNFNVIGIDNSINMVKLAKKRAPEANFIEMNVKRLKLNPNEKFDAILSYFTMLHVEKSIFQRTIVKIISYLTEGGYFILSMVLGNYDDEALLMDKKFHYTAYDEQPLIEILKKSNLKILKVCKQVFKPRIDDSEEENQIFIYCQK